MTRVRGDGALFGRDAELAAVRGLFDHTEDGARALMLEGEAGIGKSTLWAAGVNEARDAGWTVLAAQGSQSEAGLSFAALTDLLDPVVDPVLDDLPAPQRAALEVALLRRSPDGAPAGQREIGAGTTAVLRAMSRRGPVLIAIDDLPWLDEATRAALGFALRRLEDEQIRVLVSRRVADGIIDAVADGDQTWQVEDLPMARVATLRLKPLDDAHIARLVADRGARGLSDYAIDRVVAQAHGNPFWALELAAALDQAPERALDSRPDALATLPVPRSLSALVAKRLERLASPVREVLLVASALDRPSIALARRAVAGIVGDPDAAIDEAVRTRAITASEGRLDPAHPLLASAVLDGLPPLTRAALHRRLAGAVTDPEQKARHVVLAEAPEPDPSSAAIVDAGAAAAGSRGAVRAAAELADRAVEFTDPLDVRAWAGRQLTAAELHLQAGEIELARTCAEQVWHTGAPNRRRAFPLLVETTYWTRGALAAEALVAPLVTDSRIDDHTRAVVLSAASDVGDGRGTPRVDLARRAIALFERVEEPPEPASYCNALVNLALAQLEAGEGIAFEIIDRVEDVQRSMPYVIWSSRPQVLLACWHKVIDDLDASRFVLTAQIAEARDRGEEAALPTLYGHLGLTEVWAGRYDKAREAIDEALRLRAYVTAIPLTVRSADGLLAVLTGHPDTARAMVADLLKGEVYRRADEAFYRHILGLAALLEGNDEEAVGELTSAYAAARETGQHEPGRRNRLEGDLAQALVNVGRLEEAAAVGAEVLALGLRMGRPTLIGLGRRIEGLVAASTGDLDRAAEALAAAVSEHERCPLPLELGHSLLALGQVQRRRRAKADANRTLRAALDRYTALGATAFAEQAERELGWGIRGRSGAALTPAEGQVAELVAAGLTNREVAARLFASVRTVETHLTSIYRKLEIRSRSELAARYTAERS